MGFSGGLLWWTTNNILYFTEFPEFNSVFAESRKVSAWLSGLEHWTSDPGVMGSNPIVDSVLPSKRRPFAPLHHHYTSFMPP